jgi:hypothetical protein
MQVNAHEYIRTAIYLGVIAVVLRHRRWVKPARENCIARGRNTCDSIDYTVDSPNNYDKVV